MQCDYFLKKVVFVDTDKFANIKGWQGSIQWLTHGTLWSSVGEHNKQQVLTSDHRSNL